MSKINDLIKEMCPNGVPFKKIGDICETITDYVAAGSFKDLANNVKYLQEPDYAMLIRTTDIKSKFKKQKRIDFFDLFEVKSKEYVVVTFLAILEMAKNRELIIYQDDNFSNIVCEAVYGRR